VKKKILIVDDDSSVCHSIQLLLEDQYECETCANAFDALGILFGQQKDMAMLIIDLVMPGMDGGTLIQAIRRIEDYTPRHPRRLIILITGFSPDHVGVGNMIKKSGCDAFMAKPTNTSTFLSKVEELFANHST
jgi:CheY-like chemotaxis protein